MNKRRHNCSLITLLLSLVAPLSIGATGAVPAVGNSRPAEVPLNLFTPATTWTYAGGWEYPGAKGDFHLQQDEQKPVGALSYDFTGGGVYVSASTDVAIPTGYRQIRFRIKAAQRAQAALRLIDVTGQVHQYPEDYTRPGEWQQFQIAMDSASLEHYAGVNDGIVHFPVQKLSLLAEKGTGPLTGRLEFAVISAAEPTDYVLMGQAAVKDLLRHFWTDTTVLAWKPQGHVLPTYAGYANPKPPDQRGILWERATFISVLENYYETTKDPGARQRLAQDWAWEKGLFSLPELTGCGGGSQNPACDDAGWSAVMYLNIYRATADPAALACAKALFMHAYDRWADGKFGGGLSYQDDRKSKASYQVALILAGLRVYEITGDKTCWDRALALYNWAEKHLLRPDGLYWCVIDENGPQRMQGALREASADTFLAGNMGMGIIQARLYRDTHELAYRLSAFRTADAILAHETDGKGCFLDDRDSFANGYFMGDWVREVLTLPGIKRDHADLVKQTALAIWMRDRTASGFYGGCWNGPTVGHECPWYRPDLPLSSGQHTMPDQIMVSSSAVNIIAAAAQLQALGL
ncbi:MAG: glycoside hydrolase family 76 protein [Armatimonadota bacterium]|nr:glycoside hydrolase family 76 protein [Armatimonadota bacterium]